MYFFSSGERTNEIGTDLFLFSPAAMSAMDACYKDREVDWKMTSRGIWYFRDGKSVVISFSHPEARVKDAYLFYALTDAVKEIMRCEEFEEKL